MPDQTYCDRLRQDMVFLTSHSRLSEQLVDKIILQLNRVYPQILTNKEAEKFRSPKVSLHSRLSNLIAHLQKKGDKPCQEFYRALQINAEQLYNNLPSRKILKTSDSTGINPEKEQYILNDRGPTFFLACFSVAAGLAFFMYCCNPDNCSQPQPACCTKITEIISEEYRIVECWNAVLRKNIQKSWEEPKRFWGFPQSS